MITPPTWCAGGSEGKRLLEHPTRLRPGQKAEFSSTCLCGCVTIIYRHELMERGCIQPPALCVSFAGVPSWSSSAGIV